jgi:hypothetical protein
MKSMRISATGVEMRDYVRDPFMQETHRKRTAQIVERRAKRRINAAYPADEQLRILRQGDQAKITEMNMVIDGYEAFAADVAERIRGGEEISLRELQWPTPEELR